MDNFPHLPTILFVGAAVLTLVFILNKWLFGPLNRILAAREAETEAAREAFEAARATQDERLAAIEVELAQARKEAFGIREQEQLAGKAKRDEVLAAARADASEQVEKAKAELQAEVDSARQTLEAQADEIASSIAKRLLGREVGAK